MGIFHLKELELLKKQLKLIEDANKLLNELLESTYTSPQGRRVGVGCGSFYPSESLKLLDIMKYSIDLELEEHERYKQGKRLLKIEMDSKE